MLSKIFEHEFDMDMLPPELKIGRWNAIKVAEVFSPVSYNEITKKIKVTCAVLYKNTSRFLFQLVRRAVEESRNLITQLFIKEIFSMSIALQCFGNLLFLTSLS